MVQTSPLLLNEMCKAEKVTTAGVTNGTSAVDVSGDLSNFPLPQTTLQKLCDRGIMSLFPVQCMTFEHIYNGSDVVVQAKTGTGKTLAFALPIVCKLEKREKKLKFGRKPRVLVMAPTRELVSQIAADFQSIISGGRTVESIYGGVPYQKQLDALRAGVDIVIGAPGRLGDLLEQEQLDLSKVKYVILDEVDRMLDMGFKDSVTAILDRVYPKNGNEDSKKQPQTLLFSATMSDWINGVVSKYLRLNAVVRVDLVTGTDTRAATTVQHLALQCPWRERQATIADCIRVYCGAQSRCIVFCERKKDADELAAHSSMTSDSHVLHGDIPQEKRELVLRKFREGKYTVLITTNVAARGLDIPEVDLVIQCQPPKDVDDYVHRSGRTGRAGRSGICICFFDQRDTGELRRVEKLTGITFRRISAPSAASIVEASLHDTIASFDGISDTVSDVFMESAQELINRFGAQRAVALALAKMSGKIDEMRPRSALTSKEGFTAYILKSSNELKFKGFLYSALRKCLSDEVVDQIKAVQFVKGHLAIAFDLPSELDVELNSKWHDTPNVTLAKLTEMPDLEEQLGNDNNFRKVNGRNSFGNRNGDFKRKSNFQNRGDQKRRKFN